jgi:hypothetical protein
MHLQQRSPPKWPTWPHHTLPCFQHLAKQSLGLSMLALGAGNKGQQINIDFKGF